MSFDLYFYLEKENSGFKEQVNDFFAGKKNFNTKTSEKYDGQFWYENENTGVYFSFDLTVNSNDEEVDDRAAGYINSCLSFNINYMRPLFFSYEAMPIVEEIADRLDLLIADPQDKDNPDGTPKKYSACELIDSWKKSNVWATDIYKQKGATLYYLDGEISKLRWEYLMQKDALQDKLGDITFVPQMLIVRFKNSTELYTAITWSQSISEVIPKCDYVLIMQEKRKWLGLSKTQVKIVVPYHTVIERLKNYLEPFDTTIPGTMILKPERQFDALTEFNKLEGLSFDALEGIQTDNFIDFIVPQQ